MLHFRISKNEAGELSVTEVIDTSETRIEKYTPDIECRSDWKSWHAATCVAESASLLGKTKYIPVDNGEFCYPRYDVIEAPNLGDEVSYSFNGDTLPCGTIVKISDSLRRVVTSGGKVFYRKRETALWMSGSWSLVCGHVEERNPHL